MEDWEHGARQELSDASTVTLMTSVGTMRTAISVSNDPFVTYYSTTDTSNNSPGGVSGTKTTSSESSGTSETTAVTGITSEGSSATAPSTSEPTDGSGSSDGDGDETSPTGGSGSSGPVGTGKVVKQSKSERMTDTMPRCWYQSRYWRSDRRRSHFERNDLVVRNRSRQRELRSRD